MTLAFAALDVIHNLAFAIAIAADGGTLDKVATATGYVFHDAFFAIVHESKILESKFWLYFTKLIVSVARSPDRDLPNSGWPTRDGC